MGSVNRLFVRDIDAQQTFLVGCRTLGIGAVDMDLTVYCAVSARFSDRVCVARNTLRRYNQENQRCIIKRKIALKPPGPFSRQLLIPPRQQCT